MKNIGFFGVTIVMTAKPDTKPGLMADDIIKMTAPVRVAHIVKTSGLTGDEWNDAAKAWEPPGQTYQARVGPGVRQIKVLSDNSRQALWMLSSFLAGGMLMAPLAQYSQWKLIAGSLSGIYLACIVWLGLNALQERRRKASSRFKF